jgi:hypothetical protein
MTDKKQRKYSTQSYSTVSPYTSVAGVTFIEKDGDAVAEVYGADEDGRALATLFASAPDMLDELERVALGLENIDSEWAKERLEFVREVIAKAKGSK